MEPSYNFFVPPPYSTINFTTPPPDAWPSVLATYPSFPDTAMSPASTPATTYPIPQPVPVRPLYAPPAPHAPPASPPRRTLTDEDRRRMCLYHEENKSAKQTEIGALFGVERSTVSKVLRQKEKYLSTASRSPIKRSKGKVPDIDKTLANWVKRYKHQRLALTDAMIMEKANFFATTCVSSNGKQTVLTSNWLENFKQKNNLTESKSRRNSMDTVASDGEGLPRRQSPTDTQKSTRVSPILPTGLTPSPLSPPQSQEKAKKELSFFDFTMDQGYLQSTISLDTIPSLSAGVGSPTSPLISGSPLTPTMRSRLPSISSTVSQPRSQTFPLLSDGEHMDAKHSKTESLSVSRVRSPLEEEKHNIGNVSSPRDNSVIKRKPNSPDLRPPTGMQPPPVPVSGSGTTVSSPISLPGSPTQDEARQALELVMSYIQNQPSGLGLQASDYITMGKLMEKLKLVHNQPN